MIGALALVPILATCSGSTDSTATAPENDTVTQAVGPGGGTVVTPSGAAGVQIPAGTFSQQVMVTITRLPTPGSPGAGPLSTSLKQYGPYYDFTTSPLVAQFGDSARVGVCQVTDPSSPFYPPEPHDRLRLAHTVGTTIEILERVGVLDFLRCTAVTASISTPARASGGWRALAASVVRGVLHRFAPAPLYAAHGGLGGKVKSFSPFGAVDPGPQSNLVFSSVPSGTSITVFMGVWGASASDVWAVGQASVLHYNGTSWARVSIPTIENLGSVWGTSAADVWSVGTGGTILHYNGASWSSVSSGTTRNIRSVWGTSASNVWAVGDSGTILSYNGTSWSGVSSGTTQNFMGVWGTSASDVWAVGSSGTIVHFTGTGWSSVSSGTIQNLTSVWGASASDVWAVGLPATILHYNGTGWSSVSGGTTRDLIGVWGTSAADAWSVGEAGTIVHYNGSSWSNVSSGSTQFLFGVWGSSASDVWAVGVSGTILHGSPP